MPSDHSRRVKYLLDVQGEHREEQRLLRTDVEDYSPHATSSTGGTFAVFLADGTMAYHKRHDQLDSATCDLFGHNRNTPPLHECAAWMFAKALGSRYEKLLPATVYRKIDGEYGSLAAGLDGIKPARKSTLARVPDQVNDAGFLDVLIGQQDRHVNNYLWDEAGQRLGLIDHGFCFPGPRDHINTQQLQRQRWDNLTALQSDEIEAVERVLHSNDLLGIAPLLEPERADEMRRRLSQLIARPRVIPRPFR